MREAGRCCMAMGRQADRQGDLMVSWSEMPRSPGHVFYDRLQQVLVGAGFDGFVETTCKPFYAATMGARSVPPGRYFRMHMVGYFEGIDSERGIAWRCADSLSLREFLRLESRERVPDHSWLSKTRSRLPQEVRRRESPSHAGMATKRPVWRLTRPAPACAPASARTRCNGVRNSSNAPSRTRWSAVACGELGCAA